MNGQSSVPAYNWNRGKFEQFQVQPHDRNGSYVVSPQQAPTTAESRFRQLQEERHRIIAEELLSPSSSLAASFSATHLTMQGEFYAGGGPHLSASMSDMGRVCSSLIGQVMSSVSTMWPFAAAQADGPTIVVGGGVSSLNPNAKAFTPALNPNAKEFKPKSSSPEPSVEAEETQQKTPDCSELKSVSERRCTPFIKPTSEEAKTEESPSNTAPSANLDNGENKAVEEDAVDLQPSECPSASDSCSSLKKCLNRGLQQKPNRPPRLRSQSSCSSDGSFTIEFGSPSSAGSPASSAGGIVFTASPRVKKSSLALFTTHAADSEDDDDDDSEDEEDDYDDSDSDWDEIDEKEAAVVDDLDDFAEFVSDEKTLCSLSLANYYSLPFQNCGLVCPIAERKSSITSTSGGPVDTTDSKIHADPLERLNQSESNPEVEAKLRRANETWTKLYEDVDTPELGCDGAGAVSFADPETWTVVSEDPAMAEALREARVSDYIRRQSELERLSRIISPVLEAKHRKEVYERLYGGDDSR